MAKMRSWLGTVLVALSVAAYFLAIASSASALETIYWGNQGNSEIHFANLGSGVAGSLQTGSATVSEPDGLAFDVDAGRVYWGNDGEETISYANLDGSGGGGQLAAPGATISEVEGLAIDPERRKIYWANRDGSTIQYANLDGSGGGPLPTGLATVNNPSGLAIDLAAGRLYWVNSVGAGTVSYANLDGSGGGNIVVAFNFPFGPAIDPVASRIYWSTKSNVIEFVGLNGTGAGVLPTTGATTEDIRGLAVDHSRGQIYWANFDGLSLSYANLDGSGGGELPVTAGYVGEPIRPAIYDPSIRAKRPAPPLPGPPAPARQCVVPKLKGKKLKASKKRIRGSDCRVGKLRKSKGATARAGKVIKQHPKAGARLPAGSKVSVKLG